ncbi:MAG TPA: PAS domain S-box protein, partial [Edaphobacter sp.]|nr:PAS domain S-box protein [Edaphobacter sp.]
MMLGSRYHLAYVSALVLAGVVFPITSTASTVVGRPPPSLTLVRTVRALTPDEAREARPVRLRGVVTVLSGWKSSFFFQDGSSGISVDRTNDSPELQSGEEVEIRGVSGAGKFAPIVIAESVRVLGQGKLPFARLFKPAELGRGEQDSQWLSIRGIVRSAEIKSSWSRFVLFLNIDIGGGRLVTTRVHDYSRARLDRLVGATVRVRGVCGTIFNEKRQFVELRLFVASLDDVEIEKRAPAKPFDQPSLPLSSLLQFDEQEAAISQVKVSGIVTYSKPGQGLYIQDGSQGVFIRSGQTTPVAVGARLEAVGYPAAGRYSPVLNNAVFRVIGVAQAVAPTVRAASDMIVTKDGFESAPYDSVLVQLKGTLVQEIPGREEDLLLFQSGGSLFTSRLSRTERPHRGLATGSVLRITGICAANVDEAHDVHSFEILPRSSGDLVVLEKAPWWTASHAAWIVVLLILVVLGMLGWFAVMRRRDSLRVLVRRSQEMAEHLAAVVESSSDAIISKTLDGTITAWNHGAEKVFGYTSAEVVGKSITLLYPSESADEESGIATRIRSGESVDHFDTVRVTKDGKKIDVSVTISPLRDSAGVIVGASKIARDITERKQAEGELRESEERFHAMLNGIPQLAWTAEPDGHVFWFNQRWYDYTGTTLEQTKGWDWQSVHDPEILPKVLDQWKIAIAEGTPFEMELPLRAGDGHFGMFLTRVMPLKDANGRVVRWFGTNTDISGLKQTELQLTGQAKELVHRAEELATSRQALETQTHMLQSVLDSMGEGLIAADGEGHFLIWNDAAKKLMGRGASDLRTEQWTPHYKVFLSDGITPYPPDLLPLVRALHGESVRVELMVEHPERADGVFLEVTARPLTDNQGKLGGGVAVLRDITERKAGEREVRALNQSLEARVIARTAELKAANKELDFRNREVELATQMKSKFLASMSHELRTPLNAIMGFSDLLAEGIPGDLNAKQKRFVNHIKEGSAHLLQLINDILDLSKIEAGQLELRCEV